MIDKTPPILPSGCGTNGTREVFAAAGATNANYSVVWANATDNDGQTPTLVATHQAGVHTFQLGQTAIYGFYYDASGNRAECTRYILVRKYRFLSI